MHNFSAKKWSIIECYCTENLRNLSIISKMTHSLSLNSTLSVYNGDPTFKALELTELKQANTQVSEIKKKTKLLLIVKPCLNLLSRRNTGVCVLQTSVLIIIATRMFSLSSIHEFDPRIRSLSSIL